jgi:hypothetical protein
MKKSSFVFILFILIGAASFAFLLLGGHPERAWQAYLINFLFWSAVSQGAVLFSVVMHITKARWAGFLSGVAESFAAFFPFSFILFLLLFLGRTHVFSWLHEEIPGWKGMWLNLPFLFTRDLVGLLFFYGVGCAYLYFSLQLRIMRGETEKEEKSYRSLRAIVGRRWEQRKSDPRSIKRAMTVFGVLYIFAFTFIISLLAFDLLMSLQPHWFSTLFGAYCFIKASYLGLAAIIVVAFVFYLRDGSRPDLSASQFHDMGKLLFAFCLIWADFFYVQLLVIWYGNIPEETHYVIQRTMMYPWRSVAWFVFIICFIIPFFVLLNQRIKSMPIPMIGLCSLIFAGMWLEHLLLVGPALSAAGSSLPISPADLFIAIGFFGLMAFSIRVFLGIFPGLTLTRENGKEHSGAVLSS